MKTMNLTFEKDNSKETSMRFIEIADGNKGKGELHLESYRRRYQCSSVKDVKAGDKFTITLSD